MFNSESCSDDRELSNVLEIFFRNEPYGEKNDIDLPLISDKIESQNFKIGITVGQTAMLNQLHVRLSNSFENVSVFDGNAEEFNTFDIVVILLEPVKLNYILNTNISLIYIKMSI